MTPTRKILVLSASFGAGHDSAAEAIRQYYSRHYADETKVSVVDFFEEFAPGLNVLAKFAYQQPAPFFPALFGTFGELEARLPTNPVVHELRLMGVARARAYVDSHKPDAVVATFPVAGGVAAEVCQSRDVVSANVLCDFDTRGSWLHPGNDVYFVAAKEAREDLVVRGIPWDRIVVSGVPIRECFSEDIERTECRREFGLANRFTVLLVSLAVGPGELKDLAGEIASTGVQTVVVAGKSERAQKRLKDLAETTENLRVFGFVEGMNRMVRSADLVVGRAGALTVFEALALGVPLVVHSSVPGQEQGNVDFMVNCGAGFASRDGRDTVEKVRFLSAHPERMAQLSAAAAGIGRVAAAQTVCERVLAELR